MTYNKIEVELGFGKTCEVWVINSKREQGFQFEDVTIAELSGLLTKIREACVYTDKHGVMKISSAKAAKFHAANWTAELRNANV